LEFLVISPEPFAAAGMAKGRLFGTVFKVGPFPFQGRTYFTFADAHQRPDLLQIAYDRRKGIHRLPQMKLPTNIASSAWPEPGNPPLSFPKT
jgi:hypothetical protein